MRKTRISKGKQEWALLTLLLMRANAGWGTEGSLHSLPSPHHALVETYEQGSLIHFAPFR